VNKNVAFSGLDGEHQFVRREPALRAMPDPLAFLAGAHRDQLRICDLLEEIADSLPSQVDRLKCFVAAGRLRTSVRIHQMDEEKGLFPLLRRDAAADHAVIASLDRLESEHIEDDSLATDIVDALENLARGKFAGSAETLAFMLRAFFDSHRRHIAFENEVILPAAQAMLGRDALAEIEQVMLANRAVDPASFFPVTPCAPAKAAFLTRTDGAAV
jgi:hemerythrin-like domain-containing protein